MITSSAARRVAAIAFACAVLPAQAEWVKWNGFAAGSVNVTVGQTNAGTSVSTKAGAFNVLVDGASLLTYCVELTQYASSSTLDYALLDGVTYFDTNYAPALTVGGAAVVDRLGRLFTALGGMQLPAATATTTAAQTSAAIQLAVWESVYEDANPLGVGGALGASNRFAALSAPAAVVNLADQMLAQAALVSNVYDVKVLRYGTQPQTGAAQDYLVLQRVPEPGSLALGLLALTCLGAQRRARRR